MLFQYPYGAPAGQFQGVFQVLQSWGFVDALLPFLLIFALLFATLQKLPLFEEKERRKISGIIAFVISLLVVIPHITRTYPPGMDPILILANILPSFAILLLVILLVVMLLGFVGGGIPSLAIWLVTIAALIILVIVILQSMFPAFAPFWLQGVVGDPNMQALIIILVVFGLIVYFVTREESKTGDTWAQSLKKFVDAWFK